MSTPAIPPGREPARRTNWKWWIPLLVIVPTVAVLGAMVGSLGLSLEPTVPAIRGVRLGMTPEQVRTRFDEGVPADWRTAIEGGDLWLLRSAAGSTTRESRFEFHNGMLVAIRVHLPSDAPEANGPPRVITRGSVLTRTPDPHGGTSVVVLARDCPTHASEVARLLSESS